MGENSLGWDDAMDSIEALQALEEIFSIEIDNDEAAAMTTVGDLFNVILEKCPPASRGKCASAMAFYRLRQVLAAPELAPSSDITFLNARGARAALNDLRAGTGLAVPPARYARVGTFGCAAAWAGGLALAIAFIVLASTPNAIALMALAGAAVMMVAGIVATRCDKGRVPRGSETLGGLARATASASYGDLVRRGARARQAEMWAILTTMLSERANASAIDRATTFYQGQKAV